jgi:hypothetical protein
LKVKRLNKFEISRDILNYWKLSPKNILASLWLDLYLLVLRRTYKFMLILRLDQYNF